MIEQTSDGLSGLSDPKGNRTFLLFALGLMILAFFWIAGILVVKPAGDFNINDDWSFQLVFDDYLKRGMPLITGWAGGGPSVLFQLIWADGFVSLFGYSRTVLRISVLTLSIIGSLFLFLLNYRLSLSFKVALIGTGCIIANPLYFASSFTFMTDIPFISFGIIALFIMYYGFYLNNFGLLYVGFLGCLVAVLTRQMGIAIPLAVLILKILKPGVIPFSLTTLFKACLICVFVPWIGYELFLGLSGGSAITKHQVIHNIWRIPLELGLFPYLVRLVVQLLIASLYIGFFLCPIWVLYGRHLLQDKIFRYFVGSAILILILCELAHFLGVFDPPVYFHRNLIYDFGLGPILLRDTYILGIARNIQLPVSVYMIMVAIGVIGIGALVKLAHEHFLSEKPVDSNEMELTTGFGFLAFISGLLCLVMILLTGFHDRYVIPILVFWSIWLIAYMPVVEANLVPSLSSVSILLIFALFSIGGVHDFFSLKKAQAAALQYVVHELKTHPCDFDGGLEFNGYNCHNEDYTPKANMSWWWVNKEKYMLTLGELENYNVVNTFNFRRLLGKDGAIHILSAGSD